MLLHGPTDRRDHGVSKILFHTFNASYLYLHRHGTSHYISLQVLFFKKEFFKKTPPTTTKKHTDSSLYSNFEIPMAF